MVDPQAVQEPHGWGQALKWYGLAALACIVVALINRGGLYYFDTAGYLEQGKSTFSSLGFTISPEDQATQTDQASATSEDDGTVVGSRSAIYSTLLTGMRFTIGIHAMVIINSLALILAVWLPARVGIRSFGVNGYSVAKVTAIPILVASFAALPFYTAYLMPDIFAPVLILIGATFAVFASDMTRTEIALGLGLGLLAVVVHPSHLLIAVLLIPLALFGALIIQRRKWWLAPGLIALLVLGGFAERMIFSRLVQDVQSSEVIYLPFLTARTIEDGPGLAVLEANCPNPEIATCALYDALQQSSDPWRLTATHIMFQRTPELGSYRLMSQEDQRLVAQEQIPFFLRVLKERPFALIGAFIGNTLQQANLYSVQYTIPTHETYLSINRITDIAPASFENARLLDKRETLGLLKPLHGIIYAISVLLIVVIVVLPQNAPPLAIRGFAMVILCGVLVNALVCGGISQPADRYGARVAFLLPIAASFILLFYSGLRSAKDLDDS